MPKEQLDRHMKAMLEHKRWKETDPEYRAKYEKFLKDMKPFLDLAKMCGTPES